MAGRGFRFRLAFSAVFATATWISATPWCFAGVVGAPGCLFGGEPAGIVAVDADFGLVLGDGRTVLLAGLDPIRPADDPVAAAARDGLSGWLVGRSVLVRPLTAETDRWGRTPALVFAAPPIPDPNGGAGGVSVAEAMLDAGSARARPDARLGTCWPVFRRLEGEARVAGLGLWQEARYAVIAAQDGPRLRAALGTLAIVEGRISRVSETRARTYLGFGHRDRDSFAITVPRPVAATLRIGGSGPANWQGRQVRVRGALDDRFGLQIELTSADQIEFTGTN